MKELRDKLSDKEPFEIFSVPADLLPKEQEYNNAIVQEW